MPFASEAQRRLLWAKHPDIAARWAAEATTNGRRKSRPLVALKANVQRRRRRL